MAYLLSKEIKALSELPGLVAKAAPRIAVHIEEFLEKTIAAGTTAGGKPWKLTLKGEKPLKRAARHMSVDAVGERIIAKIGFPEVLHHAGEAKGHIKRQVLPSDPLPLKLIATISDALAVELHKLAGTKQ